MKTALAAALAALGAACLAVPTHAENWMADAVEQNWSGVNAEREAFGRGLRGSGGPCLRNCSEGPGQHDGVGGEPAGDAGRRHPPARKAARRKAPARKTAPAPKPPRPAGQAAPAAAEPEKALDALKRLGARPQSDGGVYTADRFW